MPDNFLAAVRNSVQVAGGFTPAAAGAVQHRLRSVLWLASTGVATGALGILAADVLDTSDADTFLIVAGGTAGYTAALWAAGRAFVQQAAMVVSAAVTAAALINRGDFSDDLPGLGPWAVGVAWAVLGWLEMARPRRLVIASGPVLAVVGAMTTVGADAGMALTLATAASIIGLAVLWRDLPLLAIGTVAGLVNTRVAMTRWFPESISAAFGLVVVGLALLGAALWVTRSGRGRALPR